MKTLFCDWGTTNLRAYLIENGEIINRYSSENGLTKAKELGFKNVLVDVINHFEVSSDIPIKLSGMVGSKHGWKEAPYFETPVSLEDLRENFISVDIMPNVQILGGVALFQGRIAEIRRHPTLS